MKYLAGMLLALATGCGGDSGSEADAVPDTQAEIDTDTETPTGTNWYPKVCPGPDITQLPASSSEENDRKLLRTIAVGDRIASLIPEAREVILSPRTLYKPYANGYGGCSDAEVYYYRALGQGGDLNTFAFGFEFLLCGGIIEKIYYCPE